MRRYEPSSVVGAYGKPYNMGRKVLGINQSVGSQLSDMRVAAPVISTHELRPVKANKPNWWG